MRLISVLGNLACFTHYSTVIYPSEIFEPKAVLDAVQRYKCTALHGVPTMFIALLEVPEKYDCSTLRTGIAAGTVVTPTMMTKIHAGLGLDELTITYGMTETSPGTTMSCTTDPKDKRTSTVGKVMPHTRLKLVDEEYRTVPVGVKGQVLTAGYMLFKGYYNDPEATREAIHVDEDGEWMKTGDEGVLDHHGYLSISGRLKDLIIRGGENISPSEVENVMITCPGISDVSVVAIPDQKYGEVPAAFVKLLPGKSVTSEELTSFARARLAHYKVPVRYFFIDEFPKTASGKIQKYLLREMARHR